MMCEFCCTTSRAMHQVCRKRHDRDKYTVEDFYTLCLSLRPLFALRMAFRECDTFFLGTARRNGGMISRREGRSGIDHEDPNMADEDKGKKADDIATS